MYWNHRVIRIKDGLDNAGNQEYFYQVHEVHYDSETHEIENWTEPITICGSSVEEITRQLDLIKKSLESGKPVLEEVNNDLVPVTPE